MNPMMIGAAVLAGLLLTAPAHAFLTGDPNGGSQGAYTDQSQYDTTPTSQGGKGWPVEKMAPPKGLNKKQQDKWQQDQASKSLADAVASAAAKSAEQK